MADFNIHSIESAPAAAKDVLTAAKDEFGFLPNLLGEMAAAASVAKAYVRLGELLEETEFSPIEQQLILTSVSVTNECHYCVAAHSAGLKQAGLTQEQIDAVRESRELSDPKLDALRRFTRAMVEKRGWVEDSDVEAFLDAGYTRSHVLEVILGIAMKTLSNYINHVAGTPLDKELQPFAWEPASV